MYYCSFTWSYLLINCHYYYTRYLTVGAANLAQWTTYSLQWLATAVSLIFNMASIIYTRIVWRGRMPTLNLIHAWNRQSPSLTEPWDRRDSDQRAHLFNFVNILHSYIWTECHLKKFLNSGHVKLCVDIIIYRYKEYFCVYRRLYRKQFIVNIFMILL